MFQILPYLQSVDEMIEFVCLPVCVCEKKNSYFPNKIRWADFAYILHNNSTLRRNYIFRVAFEYLLSFCIYCGSNFLFFHILWSWLLTAYCTTYGAYAWWLNVVQSRVDVCLTSAVDSSICESLQCWGPVE